VKREITSTFSRETLKAWMEELVLVK